MYFGGMKIHLEIEKQISQIRSDADLNHFELALTSDEDGTVTEYVLSDYATMEIWLSATKPPRVEMLAGFDAGEVMH